MLRDLKQLTNKKDRINLVFLFFILLLATAIEMIGIGSIPIFAMIIIEPGSLQKYLPEILNLDFIYDLNQKKLIFYSAVLLLIIFSFKNIFLVFVNFFQAKIIKDLRKNNFNKLFFYYMHTKYEFFLQRNPAEIIRNVVSEIAKSVTYIWNLIMVVKETLIMLTIFLMLAIIDPKISLLIFSFLSIFSLSFVFITNKGIRRRGKICQEFLGKLIKTVNHGIGSIKETKILNKENYIIDIYKSNLNIVEKHTFIQNFLITLPRLLLEVLAMLIIVAVCVLFVLFDRPFETFIPLITLITVSALRLIPSFNVISTSISSIKFSSPSFRLIARELTNLKSKNIKKNNLKSFQKEKKISIFKNSLGINNLVYFYPGTSQRVINDVSFNINYGDIIGVMGSSGAGKSTLIDLIVGLLEPSEGEILVDGININESVKDWQRQIGYIPQEIYLLDDTIKANIAFGVTNNEFNQKDLYSAIESSQLAEFIKTLPEKENTQVGDRGIRLSGGQRQRIGIARSLYFKPKILIFDEPTSALDINNEKKIMKDLYSLGGELTIIIISHRYTIFEGCKKILNLKNGKINEIMSYSDLLKKKDFLN